MSLHPSTTKSSSDVSAATKKSSDTLSQKELIEKLSAIHVSSDVSFAPSKTYMWSPENTTIHYIENDETNDGKRSLIHEAAHAVCCHQNYKSDFELILLEREAWDVACKIANSLGIDIQTEYIEDCVDSYRDWQHKRSQCPGCSLGGIQINQKKYRCYFCNSDWYVSESRFCRTYRKKAKDHS